MTSLRLLSAKIHLQWFLSKNVSKCQMIWITLSISIVFMCEWSGMRSTPERVSFFICPSYIWVWFVMNWISVSLEQDHYIFMSLSLPQITFIQPKVSQPIRNDRAYQMFMQISTLSFLMVFVCDTFISVCVSSQWGWCCVDVLQILCHFQRWSQVDMKECFTPDSFWELNAKDYGSRRMPHVLSNLWSLRRLTEESSGVRRQKPESSSCERLLDLWITSCHDGAIHKVVTSFSWQWNTFSVQSHISIMWTWLIWSLTIFSQNSLKIKRIWSMLLNKRILPFKCWYQRENSYLHDT